MEHWRRRFKAIWKGRVISSLPFFFWLLSLSLRLPFWLQREPLSAMLQRLSRGKVTFFRGRLPIQQEELLIQVQLTMRLCFWLYRSSCLFRALLLFAALHRMGKRAIFVVGVRHHNGELEGHAWVTLNGEVIGDDANKCRIFTPLFLYPTDS